MAGGTLWGGLAAARATWGRISSACRDGRESTGRNDEADLGRTCDAKLGKQAATRSTDCIGGSKVRERWRRETDGDSRRHGLRATIEKERWGKVKEEKIKNKNILGYNGYSIFLPIRKSYFAKCFTKIATTSLIKLFLR